MYRKGEEVEVLPGNEAIWYLITRLPNQWEVSWGGMYALKLEVFIQVAERLGIQPDQAFFEKLRLHEKTVLDLTRKGKKTAPETDEEYMESMRQAKESAQDLHKEVQQGEKSQEPFEE